MFHDAARKCMDNLFEAAENVGRTLADALTNIFVSVSFAVSVDEERNSTRIDPERLVYHVGGPQRLRWFENAVVTVDRARGQ